MAEMQRACVLSSTRFSFLRGEAKVSTKGKNSPEAIIHVFRSERWLFRVWGCVKYHSPPFQLPLKQNGGEKGCGDLCY